MAPGLTFRATSWAEIEERAAPMFAAHWREIGHDMPYDLDAAMYRALDGMKELRCIIAESGMKIAGYAVSLVRPWAHCKGRTLGYVDAYYLAPQFREGLAGVRFLRAVEDDLKAAGADTMLIGTMAAVDRAPVLERMGFGKAETIYRKDFA